MIKFGVRPYPQSGESFNSYLLRVAVLNGIWSIKDLLISIDLPRLKKRNLGRWQNSEFLTCLAHLAPRLGRTPEACAPPFSSERQYLWAPSHQRVIHDIRTDFPRVCPYCLFDSGIICWQWSIAYISNCTKHECPLVDTCPKCDGPLEWKSTLLTGCTRCDFAWKDAACPARSSPLTDLEEANRQKIQTTDFKHDESIADICAAIVVMARPFDTIHDEQQSVPYIRDFGSLVETAYAVLEDENHRTAWLEEIQNARKDLEWLGHYAINAPFDNLKKLLSAEKSAQFKPGNVRGKSKASVRGARSFAEHAAFTSLTRRNAIGNKNVRLRYQAKAPLIAKSLNLRIEDLNVLIGERCLNPVTSAVVARDQLFDLHDVIQILKQLTVAGDKSIKYTKVTASDDRLTRYFAQYGKLIVEVINGQIDGYINLNTRFDAIYVSSQQFQTFLWSQLKKTCEAPIPVRRIIKRLGCDEKKLREWASQGFFSWARWSRDGERVDGPSFYEFVKNSSVFRVPEDSS